MLFLSKNIKMKKNIRSSFIMLLMTQILHQLKIGEAKDLRLHLLEVI